jgi:hypothetical protein
VPIMLRRTNLLIALKQMFVKIDFKGIKNSWDKVL